MTDDRTPGQRAYAEHLDTRRKNARAGLPNKSASNRARVNNVAGEEADSQGVSNSLARRAVPDASFGQATYEAYERYADNDPLAAVERERSEATVRATI